MLVSRSKAETRMRSQKHDGGRGNIDRIDLSRHVARDIIAFMLRNKISRTELATRMGVSPGRISQILSGDENLTLRSLSVVVSALGASIELSIGAAPDMEDKRHDEEEAQAPTGEFPFGAPEYVS